MARCTARAVPRARLRGCGKRSASGPALEAGVVGDRACRRTALIRQRAHGQGLLCCGALTCCRRSQRRHPRVARLRWSTCRCCLPCAAAARSHPSRELPTGWTHQPRPPPLSERGIAGGVHCRWRSWARRMLASRWQGAPDGPDAPAAPAASERARRALPGGARGRAERGQVVAGAGAVVGPARGVRLPLHHAQHQDGPLLRRRPPPPGARCARCRVGVGATSTDLVTTMHT